MIDADGTVGVWDTAEPKRPVCRALIWASALDVKFTPDAKTLVSVGRQGALHFWDGNGRLVRRSTDRHDGPAHALSVGSDRIASGGDDGMIRLWNMDGTSRGAPLMGHQGGVLAVALSSNGSLLSFGVDQTVRLWKARAGAAGYEQAAELPVVKKNIVTLLPQLLAWDVNWGWRKLLAFSPDATHFAAAAFDGAVRLWDAGGAPVGAPMARQGNIQVHSVAYAPNGRGLAAAYQDGAIGFWQNDGKETSPTLTAHQGAVYSIDFDAATRLASAGADESVRLWGPSRERLGELPPPRPHGVHSIAVAPSGDVVATGDDRGVIRIWNLDGAMRGSPITAHRGAVHLLAWSPDGKALTSAGADQVVCAWTVDGKKTAARKLPDLTTALAYSPDGQTVATVARFAPVRLWQGEKLMPVMTPERMRGHTTSLAFSSDGTMMAGSSNVIQIWKVDGSSSSPQVEGMWGELQSIAFSPKGDVVAAAALDGTVRLWNLDGTPNGEPRPAHRGAVFAVAFAQDGRLASGGEDGAVVVWPAGSGAPATIDTGRSVSQLGFMTDGRLWVRGRAGDLRLFDRELRPLGDLYFNTDGSVVISYDGWFSGEWPPLGWQVEVFRDGKPVGVAATASRFSPERVRARLAVDGRGSAKSGS